MAGLGMDRLFPLVILMACINTIRGQVCPASNFPVAVMCTSGTWIGPRVFLDTSQTPEESKNCTCILETTAEEITVSLLTAPNFGGCQSSLEFKAADPFTFSCMKAGTAAQVSEKKEFEVYFKKSDDRFGNNYCADIQAKASPGGALTTVTLSCFGEAQTITSATSTTTSTTTTTTTTTKPTTDFQMTSSQFTEQTSEGMITTDGITFTTTTEPKTTTSYVGYTGFPSSVSQTASEPMFKLLSFVLLLVLVY